AKHTKLPVAWQSGLFITCEYTPPDEKKESLVGVTLYDSENTRTNVTYSFKTGNCSYSGEIKGICEKNSSVTMLTAVFTNQQPNEAKAFNCVAQFYKGVPWNELVGQTNVSPAARRQNSDGSYADGLKVGVLSVGIPLLAIIIAIIIILACVVLYDRCQRFKAFVRPAVVKLRCCFRKKDVSVWSTNARILKNDLLRLQRKPAITQPVMKFKPMYEDCTLDGKQRVIRGQPDVKDQLISALV
ncbi:hypothetical protein BaRGS_00016627, partial [Batillaria attramentaria]